MPYEIIEKKDVKCQICDLKNEEVCEEGENGILSVPLGTCVYTGLVLQELPAATYARVRARTYPATADR